MRVIETEYNGYKFRSRIEARWAVFLDAMDIEYQYEPEGYELKSGERYLPDFYLPEDKVWLEVKGGNIGKKDLLKCEEFAYEVQEEARFRILSGGIPKVGTSVGESITNKGSKYLMRGIPAYSYQWISEEIPEEVQFLSFDHLPNVFTRFVPSLWLPKNFERMFTSLEKARQARFEHGETPII